jgi:hypothetical protein
MGSGLTIACCLWGEFPDPGWSEEYVRRLSQGVRRHLHIPSLRVVCFADRALSITGVEFRELKAPFWKGNLPKSYVYSPEAGLEGRVLLFDLDNVIVGSLDDMAAYDGPFCVRGRLQYGRPRQPDGDMIAFEAGNPTALSLWDAARHPATPLATQGRERDFILQVVPKADQWQDVCPGQVVSYRHDCRTRHRGKLPPNARVVSMHGRPRPHEVSDEFIVRNWL